MPNTPPLLRRVADRFRVQPRFIVALWGIETDFGRFKGGFPVIASLVTLAHDGRRSAYFRRELFNALRILDEGHITPKEMIGLMGRRDGPESVHALVVSALRR